MLTIKKIIYSFLGLDETSSPPSSALARNGRIDVRPSNIPYYQQSGWKEKRNIVEGWYRCRFGAWRGEIIRTISGKLKFFIFNPPPQLKEHSHWHCFNYTGKDNRYFIHFSKDSSSLDAGIMAIQRILDQSFRDQRR